MDGALLARIREMADLSVDEFARRRGVSGRDLAEMEAGRMEIPARFVDDVYVVADQAIRDMGYP